MTGETVESMLAAIAYLSPALIGETALHDLIGRATGRPAYDLLGGKKRNRMAALAVIGTGDIGSDLEQAQSQKEQGYTAFKIKVGIDKPPRDAERTRAIC